MVKDYRKELPKLGVYITPETREAIKETACKRDKEHIAEIEQHLHDELDKYLRMIAVNEITGKDFIIYTPERAIGKNAGITGIMRRVWGVICHRTARNRLFRT